MSAADTLNARISEGFTILIGTYGRVTKWTPKAVQAWRKTGHDVFKMNADGVLLMIEGQKNGKPRYVLLPQGGFNAKMIKA